MNLSFENRGVNTYLVYAVNGTDELDTMSLGMLTNNRIPGFAAASYMQMDNDMFIKYNVSAKVSAKQLFSGPVNKKRLLGVLRGVVDAMLNAEEYMLDQQSILLDLDYIFADVSTCAAELICLPILNLQEQQLPVEMFFKNLLFTTQFDQTENCDHVAQLINYLNRNPVLSLADFKELLDELSGAAKPATYSGQQPVAEQPKVQPAPVTQVNPVQRTNPVVQQQPVVSSTPVNTTPAVTATPSKSVGTMPLDIPQGGMQIPNAKPAPEAKPQSAEGEKEISWFYLMQHYNKENAALYKAQQDAKKNKKNEAAPAKAAKQKPAPVATPKQQPNPGYAIPGQQGSSSFAIPGQSATVTPVNQQPKQPVQQKVVSSQPAQQPVQQQVIQQPVQQQVIQQQPVQQVVPNMGAQLNFGETMVLDAGAIGETMDLSAYMAANQSSPHLIRVKNNERIPLNKSPFHIGKERSYADYFVGDNTAISRSHADIYNRNGEFFVVDTNSKNHTYVNGAMITSNVETKLNHGDKVRLANEDFEFKMY